eukprot:m.96378 g.96378  ORF g.96378 m.96378 type:complete len:331 (+) comp26891_c0_seq1:85-1077(+)
MAMAYEYPRFESSCGFQCDEWDDLGFDIACALDPNSQHADDMKSCFERARCAKIPQDYAFPECEEKKLVSDLLEEMGKLGLLEENATAPDVDLNEARLHLGRRGKKMSDEDVLELLKLAKDRRINLDDLRVRRLLLLLFDAAKLRDTWKNKEVVASKVQVKQKKDELSTYELIRNAELVKHFEATKAEKEACVAAIEVRSKAFEKEVDGRIQKAKRTGDTELAEILGYSRNAEMERLADEKKVHLREIQLLEAEVKEFAATSQEREQALQKAKDELAQDECPICLEHFHEPTRTRCHHIFCTECIRLSCMVKKECPNCRAPCSLDECTKL